MLSLREADFIRRVPGARHPDAGAILLRHVLPNIAPIIIVQVTLSLSWAVLTEASLSFLGLGTPPPAPVAGLDGLRRQARWSRPGLVDDARPGAMIVVFVVGLNLLGDGLRDALDPR